LGFRVQDVICLASGIKDLGYEIKESGFKVYGSGLSLRVWWLCFGIGSVGFVVQQRSGFKVNLKPVT